MGSNKIMVVAIVLIVVFAGIAGVLFFNNQTLSAEINSLTAQLNNLQASYNDLQMAHDSLQSSYNSLQSSIAPLQANYSSLQMNYSALQTNFTKIRSDLTAAQQKYSAMYSVYQGLNDDVAVLNSYLNQLRIITLSFSRIFTPSAYNDVASAVESATGNSPAGWSSYQKIYNYIHNNIEYVRDVSSIDLVLDTTTYSTGPLAGMTLLTDVGFEECDDYIQTPQKTLDLGQGDCEDQAILCYAMMKYYMLQIQGIDYNLYLAFITFNSGAGHMAVFLPVTEGRLCILDNAGNYLTKSGSTITQRDAHTELHNYSSHWSSESGIKSITLYAVNVMGGSYSTFASGTIDQVAVALGSTA